MSKHITIPKPATFIDPGSNKKATMPNEAGEPVDLPDRDHEWFMHVYILSHLQFNTEVGGAEASRASAEIARSLKKAVDEDAISYEVSDDNHRRIKCCIARATDEDWKAVQEATKINPQNGQPGKPDPRILAKSTLGMTRALDNFTATSFMDHFDALEDASTKKPEPQIPATVEVGGPVGAALS